MFLVLIRYTRPIEEVLSVRPAHREFLRRHYATGRLVCSGPRVDETGGIVLARGENQVEVEAVFAGDPYRQAGVAVHEVVEFDVKSHDPRFAPFLAPMSAPADRPD